MLRRIAHEGAVNQRRVAVEAVHSTTESGLLDLDVCVIAPPGNPVAFRDLEVLEDGARTLALRALQNPDTQLIVTTRSIDDGEQIARSIDLTPQADRFRLRVQGAWREVGSRRDLDDIPGIRRINCVLDAREVTIIRRNRTHSEGLRGTDARNERSDTCRKSPFPTEACNGMM